MSKYIVRSALASLIVVGVCSFGISAKAGSLRGQPAPAPRMTTAAPYAKYSNAGISPANIFNAGVTQPYMLYSNKGISSANIWNSGATQPYLRYSNAGISPANAWNAGASQPYNQYHCVPNVGQVGANGVCP